jgi:hypothetical protein
MFNHVLPGFEVFLPEQNIGKSSKKRVIQVFLTLPMDLLKSRDGWLSAELIQGSGFVFFLGFS